MELAEVQLGQGQRFLVIRSMGQYPTIGVEDEAAGRAKKAGLKGPG